MKTAILIASAIIILTAIAIAFCRIAKKADEISKIFDETHEEL